MTIQSRKRLLFDVIAVVGPLIAPGHATLQPMLKAMNYGVNQNNLRQAVGGKASLTIILILLVSMFFF